MWGDTHVRDSLLSGAPMTRALPNTKGCLRQVPAVGAKPHEGSLEANRYKHRTARGIQT